jgi:Holliday junction resolvasome RuvABC ATP-dependent DNA helicase subunit
MHSAVSDQTSSPLPARTGPNGTQQPAVADIEPSPNDGAVRIGRAWLDSEQAVTMPGSRCQPANGWFVLVAGWPGSGKSTLAAALAAEPGVPLLAKDEIKEALVEGLGRQKQ